MNLVDLVIKSRCSELARGLAPKDRQEGICWDVYRSYREVTGASGHEANCVYTRLNELFEGLGLGHEDPLGDYWRPGDHWEGERGERRRELAGKVAALLGQWAEATV